MMEGDLTGAKNFYLKALRISFEAHSIPITLDSFLGLAQVHAKSGKAEYALELLQHILDHPYSIQDTKDRAIEVRNEVRKLLNDDQLSVVDEKGLSQTFDELVSNVLLEDL